MTGRPGPPSCDRPPVIALSSPIAHRRRVDCLGVHQVQEHRQRDQLVDGLLGDRAAPGSLAEVCVHLLTNASARCIKIRTQNSQA